MSLQKADKFFSLYIRARDSDDNGMGRCIACGKVVHWKDADCGHFINRRHMSLRYNEKNCNLECRSCNRFDEGNPAGYALGLQAKYGEDIIKILLAAKNSTHKLSKFDLEQIAEVYRLLTLGNTLLRLNLNKRKYATE